MKGDLRDTWVAVSLERYIAAQGSSPQDAIREFTAMLASELVYGIEYGDATRPLAGIEPAPAKYWDKFEMAKPYDPPEVHVALTVEPRPQEVHMPAVEQYRLAA